MLTFGLLGAGNIAKIHAVNLAANPRTRLKHVVDVDASAAGELARAFPRQIESPRFFMMLPLTVAWFSPGE